MWLLAYLALGAVTGVFAGLFGIGGGGIMVPVLTVLFAAQFVDAHAVHLALGTSMAAIVPTALASLHTHHRHGAVHWPAVGGLAPGLVAGTLAGTFVAGWLTPQPLALIFAAFMAYVAVQLIVNRKPRPSRRLPGRVGLAGVGGGIGGMSALVAIGGGTMTVPFLTWCNLSLPRAIGTSAAAGLPIAATGAIGYLLNGWHTPDLPAHSLGYVYWPAVLVMASASLLTAPLGARLTHRLPVALLRKLFALLVIGLSLQMLYTVFG